MGRRGVGQGEEEICFFLVVEVRMNEVGVEKTKKKFVLAMLFFSLPLDRARCYLCCGR